MTTAAFVIRAIETLALFSSVQAADMPPLNQLATSFNAERMAAGFMFDIEAKNNIFIHGLDINTKAIGPAKMEFWTRAGTYKGHEKSSSEWRLLFNSTVQGNGLDVPTSIPAGSFSPILVNTDEKRAFYVACPKGACQGYILGTEEGSVVESNSDMIIYEGIGRRFGFDGAIYSPRIWSGSLYYSLAPTPEPTSNPTPVPTPNPTGEPTSLPTLAPTANPTTVDGMLNKFQTSFDSSTTSAGNMFDITTKDNDIEIREIGINTYKRSDVNIQIWTKEGSYQSYDKDLAAWTKVADLTVKGQGLDEPTMIQAGSFEPIAIRRNSRQAFYITSDGPNIRYSNGSSEGKEFGSNSDLVLYEGVGKRVPITAATMSPRVWNGVFKYEIIFMPTQVPTPVPTPAPTTTPTTTPSLRPTNRPTNSPTNRLTNPPTDHPSNREFKQPSAYFNYDPSSKYGPDNWGEVKSDRFWNRYERLITSLDNKCESGNRQSPRNLCRTSDECLEFHQPRPRKGMYDLDNHRTTKARPDAYIFPNKLRLSYKERTGRDYDKKWPEPPGVDFARNGSTGPDVQDLLNIDLKVKSEHRLCDKQYDAEMQQFYLHHKGSIEAISILIEANSRHNGHFQRLLDFFQEKFDKDERQCRRRQRRARAVLGSDSQNKEKSRLRGSNADEIKEDDFEEDDTEEGRSESIYEKIFGKFISLVERRTADSWRWDPLEPGDIWRTIHFWAYSGSMTEPPCFESVKWRVMDVPMRISDSQYDQLKKLMFDHVDPETCRKTSSDYKGSNARPVQPYRGGGYYRCRRSDYVGDKERKASGRRNGFRDKKDWRGVALLPWVEGEFPNV